MYLIIAEILQEKGKWKAEMRRAALDRVSELANSHILSRTSINLLQTSGESVLRSLFRFLQPKVGDLVELPLTLEDAVKKFCIFKEIHNFSGNSITLDNFVLDLAWFCIRCREEIVLARSASSIERDCIDGKGRDGPDATERSGHSNLKPSDFADCQVEGRETNSGLALTNLAKQKTDYETLVVSYCRNEFQANTKFPVLPRQINDNTFCFLVSSSHIPVMVSFQEFCAASRRLMQHRGFSGHLMRTILLATERMLRKTALPADACHNDAHRPLKVPAFADEPQRQLDSCHPPTTESQSLHSKSYSALNDGCAHIDRAVNQNVPVDRFRNDYLQQQPWNSRDPNTGSGKILKADHLAQVGKAKLARQSSVSPGQPHGTITRLPVADTTGVSALCESATNHWQPGAAASRPGAARKAATSSEWSSRLVVALQPESAGFMELRDASQICVGSEQHVVAEKGRRSRPTVTQVKTDVSNRKQLLNPASLMVTGKDLESALNMQAPPLGSVFQDFAHKNDIRANGTIRNRRRERMEAIVQAQIMKQQQDLIECTFHPCISHRSKVMCHNRSNCYASPTKSSATWS